MHPILNENVYFIKEHVGMFKAANNYDICDPNTGDVILECREPALSFWTKWFRFTKYKRNTPFDIQIKTPDGQPVVSVKKGIAREAAILYPFEETRKALYEGGRQAMEAIPNCKPYKMDLPIKGKMQYLKWDSDAEEPETIIKEALFSDPRNIYRF